MNSCSLDLTLLVWTICSSRRRPLSLSVVAMNSLIAACGRGRRPDLALALLNEMESQFRLRPDTRSYRSAIIACNQAEHERRLRPRRGDVYSEDAEEDGREEIQWWECAISLLRRMRENGIKADIQTFSSAISACEAAGQWQRALGVLQAMTDEMEDGTSLNLYCFNAAISACEKGGAWVEALELYERMIDQGGSLAPNFITLNSLIVALEKAQQRELAQSKYEEARQMKIINPWRTTRKQNSGRIYALDLHRFSGALASAAVRSVMDSYLRKKSPEDITEDLVIITGKGLRSSDRPVLMRTVVGLLEGRYGVKGRVDNSNKGRLVLDVKTLQQFLTTKSWR
jgi:pentatricopeptide repeat protein